MSLRYGIVGLPNVGKSTLFSALSKVQVPAENYPFCTINPQEGIVHVPDARLDKLATLVQPQKVVPATLTFVDIAGLVQGASKGQGLGNQFLANIREVDAILHVVRCFDDPKIIHVAGSVDPLFDKAVIDEELQLKDGATLQKRLERLKKMSKTGNPDIIKETALVERCAQALAQGQAVRNLSLRSEEKRVVHSWQLLTSKPVIYVANIDEKTLQTGTNKHLASLQAVAREEKAPTIPLCSALEADIAMAPADEQEDYLQMYGLSQTGLDELVSTSYRQLGLITYFTAGIQEVRAWTIRQGTLAPQAASIIHSDFEKAFIKAEVIKLADYLHYQSAKACKEAGRQALEGRGYEVQDGDVIHFKTHA